MRDLVFIETIREHMVIEIIGRACVAPGARNVSELLDVLREGRCTVSEIPAGRWDHARFWHPQAGTAGKTYSFAAGVLEDSYDFDPAVFGLSKREAIFMDPQQRILLNLVWRALENANLPIGALNKERVGVYIGASSLDSGNLAAEDPASGSPYFMTGNTLSIIANRISHTFGLNGPSLTIDTACSSSLVALDHAVKALAAGEIDTAIVGGVNLLAHPLSFVGFSQARMLSPDGLCRAYDDSGNGYVRAEGGGVVILRTSARAAAENDHSYARIVATRVNSAGRTNGISLPSREAQAQLLKSIYVDGDIDMERLAFIEGHGTGTKAGDPAELWAIGQVIGASRRAPIAIGSIKSNIGHAEPASGVLGLIKAMLALEHNFVPATLHVETPSQAIDFAALNVRINTAALEILPSEQPRLAGVNSFGFGGTNAHVVISDPAPGVWHSDVNTAGNFFYVSAHTASALKSLLYEYQQRLTIAPAEALAVIASAAANRSPLRHRFVAKGELVSDILDAIGLHLDTPSSGQGEEGQLPASVVNIAFVYAGNGAQWAGMGTAAYRENSSFRQTFNDLSALFEPYLGEKLTDLLAVSDIADRLSDTKIAQPLLFAIQAALSDCFVATGIKPIAVFGHSVGEIAAAYTAGILSPADAVAIVAKRSLHQDLLAGEGTMAAVARSAADTKRHLADWGLTGLSLAAVNAPNSVTISGPVDEIDAFRKHGRKSHVPVQPLDINYPFHHPIIDRAKSAFLNDLPAISPQASSVRFISSVTGRETAGEQLGADYWWKNVREPVLFLDAAQTALNIGCNLLIEISPRQILGNYLSAIGEAASVSIAVIPTLVKAAVEVGDPVDKAIAKAVAHGAVLNNERSVGKRIASVQLPGLPFEPSTLTPTATSDKIDLFGRNCSQTYTLLGWRTDPNGTAWKNHIDAHLFPDLAEHVVDGKAIMPGSAFIEIAVNAARLFLKSAAVDVTNLEIVRTLDLRRDRILELSTIISADTGNIEIRSRDYLSDDDWAVHAFARCRRSVSSGTMPNIAHMAAGEASSLTAAQTYDTALRFGLQYGPRFRLLKRAKVFDSKVIEVDLAPPAKAAHPYLFYNLNPMSVDAAFHALVGLFGRLSGEEAGAPYVPVHFGRLNVVENGRPIAKAVVEIVRFSPNSVKANFRFFDDQGDFVASFDDCRFRRTLMWQPNLLEDQSFHYASISSPIEVPGISSHTRLRPPALSFSDASQGLDAATLLLDAAIYRGCHEIALSLCDAKHTVVDSEIPGDFKFRCFLINCFYVLEDLGIASEQDNRWTIEPDFQLPPVKDLLQEIYRHHPGRVAEAVLVNDVYTEAVDRLSALSGLAENTPVDVSLTTFIGDATLDHLQEHSPLSQQRMDAAYGLLQELLKTMSESPSISVMEIGSVSIAFSRRLADLLARAGSELTIFEPDSRKRQSLTIAFERDADVNVRGEGSADAARTPQVIISACGHLFEILRDDGPAKHVMRNCSKGHGVLIVAERAPSVFADFVYGLSDHWFSQSQTAAFPTGQLATVKQWQDLLQTLGFKDLAVTETLYPQGSLIQVSGRGSGAGATPDAEMPKAVENTTTTLILSRQPPDLSALPGVNFRHVAIDDGFAQATISGHFGEFKNGAPLAIFVAGGDQISPAENSETLQDDVLALAAYAEATRTWLDGRDVAGRRPRIMLVAPGGSPLASTSSPVNAGLWTYARVLQNEYDFLDVHILDAVGDIASLIPLIEVVVSTQTANREWLLDSTSGRLCEVRAISGPVAARDLQTSNFEAAHIVQKTLGRVDSILWEKYDPTSPADTEVLVRVAATGLNFRDVMWAMGMLPEEALEEGFAGATIGMELAGEVIAVGAAVSDLAPGDRVMGIAAAAFSTHVTVQRVGLTKIPDTLDLIAAATVPVAYLTAYYALIELGRIQRGETVLIHGAAGGVGLAALQIAKLKGATVIATAGTVEKRRFLSTLGADHVFDSRSMQFVSDVLEVTDSAGVDLVLNSLFAEAMERSIELVKPFGRFLELGKRDYYSDRKIGLRPFRRNISYFGIDADQLLVSAPAVTARIFNDIGLLFASGELSALPYRVFAHDEISDAFRLMQNAGHIGKIVVRPPSPRADFVKLPKQPLKKLDGSGQFLVVGGIGGFGLAAANWLVSKGARQIALSSRRGVADRATQETIERLSALGVTVSLHACDVTDEQAVDAMLRRLRAIAPLRGLVHAAMVLDDALIGNLNRERNRPVIDTKVKGASILDRLTRDDELELFLLFSSATTMIGNPGQANYVAANGFLEGLARLRRQDGLAGLAVGFGAISDTGFLARNAEVNESLSKRIGKTAMTAKEALRQVDNYLRVASHSDDDAVVMIANIDWQAARSLTVARAPLLEIVSRNAKQTHINGDDELFDLAVQLEGKPWAEAQSILHLLLAEEIAGILRVARDTVTPDKILKDLGMDSLMAMELGMSFQRKTGIDLPLSGLPDRTTVNEVVLKLYDKVTRQSRNETPSENEQAVIIEGLSTRHAASALEN